MSTEGAVGGTAGNAGGVAPRSGLAGGQYNLTPITLADGQQGALQVDSSGALKVSGSGSGGATAGNQTAVQTPVAPASATATKGVLGGNQYNAAPPSAADGQQLGTQADARGSTKVAVCGSDGLPVSMTDPVSIIESYPSFLNVVAGLATTTFKSGGGTFGRLIINTAGVTNTLTIYDNTAGSGTKIGTFSTAAVGSSLYGLKFATGLTMVSAGGTGADYTVTFA